MTLNLSLYSKWKPAYEGGVPVIDGLCRPCISKTLQSYKKFPKYATKLCCKTYFYPFILSFLFVQKT